MPLRLNPALAAVAEPPIPEVYGWIKDRAFPADRPLIDVSQAVPGYPPPKMLTDHLAARVGEPAMARYTDIRGLAELREALAADIAVRLIPSATEVRLGVAMAILGGPFFLWLLLSMRRRLT